MTKTIDTKQVHWLAKLAQLVLSGNEVKKFSTQLSETIKYVEILDKIDSQVKDLPPTSNITSLLNVFREDEVKPSLTQKQILANAPSTHRGYFRIKAIFK